jgi:two-component system nitrogen regulation sensor histidine kinase NtrY
MAFESGQPIDQDKDARVRNKRLPLGRNRRRLSFESRLRLWICAAAVPGLLLVAAYSHALGSSWSISCLMVLGAAAVWAIAGSVFFDSLVRPLQTLSNIVAALREDDYSFRARGARRGDALGDLALEVNALAGTLQQQRGSALDALTLADRVMTSMQSPVLAFDAGGRLRLLNVAAERAFDLQRETVLNRTADSIGLRALTELKDEALYAMPIERQGTKTNGRWSVRRAAFRLYGVPHTLFVLSDVAAALQEEERTAWQRLIRVLAHEINNSLTPIKSIATTLRTRVPQFMEQVEDVRDAEDFRRGLAVIEDRADSLNRFLQAYQALSRLPQPNVSPISVYALIERTVPLERRMAVGVVTTDDVTLCADADQLQQLIINLIKNATDAAFDPDANNDEPVVEVGWSANDTHVTLQVTDNGPGLANPSNLFVPFYTTKPEGTGIGLTLSRQIAAAHRGTVTLRNRNDGTGCIAEVIMPLLGP